MTRINTNVSSLIGRNNLGRSNAGLTEALTRLSTGLRINTGKDDPAGLIASENLRSDITSIRRAISNTERATQVIATADSALGQVSSLLNDIRGLVTESANSGALSEAQLSANQLQVDSSLEALNRIAQTTTFQGRKLLDGSLDFVTLATNNFGRIENLQIDQANLGATGKTSVDVNVTSAATNAQVNVANIPAATTAVPASGTITFADSILAGGATVNVTISERQSTGTLTLGSGAAIQITTEAGGEASGAVGGGAGGLDVVLTDNNDGSGNAGAVTYNAGSNTLSVDADLSGGATADEIAAAIAGYDSGSSFSAVVTTNATLVGQTQSTGTFNFGTTVAADLTVTAKHGGNASGAFGGASGGIDIVFTDSNLTPGGVDSATYTQGTNTITVVADFTSGTLTAGEIATAIAGINGGNDFASSSTTGATNLVAADATPVAAYTDFATGGANGDATSYANVATGGAASTNEAITVVSTPGADSNVSITFKEQAGVGATPAVSGNATDGYVIAVDGTGNTTVAAIAAAIDTISEVASATYGGSATFNGALDNVPPAVVQLSGGRDEGDDVITVTATKSGTAYNRSLLFQTSNTTVGGITVVDDGTNITVKIDNKSQYKLTDIASAITTQLSDFKAEVTTAEGSGYFDKNDVTENVGPVVTNVGNGVNSAGGITKDAVIELAGTFGAEVFNLKAGTSITELINQINLVSDATGVQATSNETTLELRSTTYGSKALVDLKVITEEDGGVFKAAVGSGARDVGEDIIATVNGIAAKGDGNELSINTATLDLKATIEPEYLGLIEFDITGGGALFQLGPDVVSNEQARVGITSVNTARLGAVSGKLFQLQSGGSADLITDSTTAARIVTEAIDQVTSLRGRLGAFQRTTLETNKNALNDTLVNLTEAESDIRDADFAAESAALTRAQILVQSGTTVLSIANQNPQNVLALLR